MLPSHKAAITGECLFDLAKWRTWSNRLNSAAANFVSGIRSQVYGEDRLVKGHGRRTKAGMRDADSEYERRNGTRQEYQRLSRYYRLEDGKMLWTVPRLLSRGKHKFCHLVSGHFTHLTLFSIARSRGHR